MIRPSTLYDMAGAPLKVGVYYWVLPEPDPHAVYAFENEAQPARFAGYDEEGFALWNWIGVDAEGPTEGSSTRDGASSWDVVWVGWKIDGGRKTK